MYVNVEENAAWLLNESTVQGSDTTMLGKGKMMETKNLTPQSH